MEQVAQSLLVGAFGTDFTKLVLKEEKQGSQHRALLPPLRGDDALEGAEDCSPGGAQDAEPGGIDEGERRDDDRREHCPGEHCVATRAGPTTALP